jgi:hypothetical protein
MSFLSKISLSCFPWNRVHHEKLAVASWKASSSSASQNMFFLLWARWFTAVFFRASVPPACPQPNSDDAQIVCALNIHFNIIPTYAHAFRISSSLQVYATYLFLMFHTCSYTPAPLLDDYNNNLFRSYRSAFFPGLYMCYSLSASYHTKISIMRCTFRHIIKHYLIVYWKQILDVRFFLDLGLFVFKDGRFFSKELQ